MATPKPAPSSRLSFVLKTVALLVVAGFAVSFFFGEAIAGYGEAGTGYAARATCGCRHIGGRDMASCKQDLPANMWAVWLSEDEAAQSVTARVPLIASQTATMREGYGCVLDRRAR